MSMISNEEVKEIRLLASKVKKLKEENYDALTWDEAIKQVVSAHSRNEDEFFRKIALLEFFIAEDKQLCSLDVFLEGLDSEIQNLKERAKDYAISESERLALKQKISDYFSRTKYPEDKNSAFDYYQVMVDKLFTSNSWSELMLSLYDLSVILKEHYPSTFSEVQMLAEFCDKVQPLIDISKEGATKKQIASALEVSVDLVGTVMHRFTQLGIFELSKKGRANVYTYKKSTFDVNTLRKEWTWLWSQPYKKLSLKLYDQQQFISIK